MEEVAKLPYLHTHPRTGMLWFRRPVPKQHWPLFGREITKSLGTKDRNLARGPWQKELADSQRKFDLADSGRWPPISDTEIGILARDFIEHEWPRKKRDYTRHIEATFLNMDDYDPRESDKVDQDQIVIPLDDLDDLKARLRSFVDDQRLEKPLDDIDFVRLGDQALEEYSLIYPPAPRTIFDGEHGPPPRPTPVPKSVRPTSSPVPFSVVITHWARDRAPKPRTKYGWERVVTKFATHLGHNDATLVTDDDIIAWKNALLDAGSSQPLVENHLLILKTLFRFAKRNKLVSTDPTAEIVFKAKDGTSKRMRGYNDDEARTILIAARSEVKHERRWVPWIAAFTGARLSEVCGATVSDIVHIDGIPCIRIEPDNRDADESIKNQESMRTVPLHPAIIDEGFLKYVAGLPKGGSLFPKLPPDRWGKRGGNGTKRLGRWIRENIGIKDLRIQPSHAWRHRFADQCRAAGIAKEHRYALDGHRSSDVGEGYGDQGYPITVLYEEIRKLRNPAG